MALTTEDKKFLMETFLTKKEAKQFATKDDLKQFATKDDLKQFATKDDLQEARNDIADGINERFNEQERKIDELKEQIAHIPSKDEMFNKLDTVVGELKTNRDQHDIQAHQVQRNTRRIEKLEKTIGIISNES